MVSCIANHCSSSFLRSFWSWKGALWCFWALAVCTPLLHGLIIAFFICTFAHSLFSFALVHTVILLESHFTGALLPTPCFCLAAVLLALLTRHAVFVPHSIIWCHENHTSVMDIGRQIGEGIRFSEIWRDARGLVAFRWHGHDGTTGLLHRTILRSQRRNYLGNTTTQCNLNMYHS